MTRRALIAGSMAGLCAPRRPLVLEAIAAEKMPHRLVVRGVAPSVVFELRDYGSSSASVAKVLQRYGISAAVTDSGKLLIGFSSLEQREKAWRLVDGNQDWAALRDRVVLKEISVYTPVLSRA